MPRPVAVKASFREDSSWLVRLETAIRKDPDLPEPWRGEFAQAAHDLARRCLEADDLKNKQREDAKVAGETALKAEARQRRK